MKKTFCIIMSFFMFFLCGCQKTSKAESNNANKVMDKKNDIIINSTKASVAPENIKIDAKNSNYPKLPVHVEPGELDSTIIEDDNYIYYFTKEGINKVDKKNGVKKLILKQTNAFGMLLSAGYLYFIKSSEDYETSGVFRIDTNGNNYLQIFDRKKITDRHVDDIRGLMIVDSTLYMDCSQNVYSYNLETKKLQFLVSDVGKFDVVGDNIYYIDHAQRTFTIYKKNLRTMKTQIIVGLGETESKGTHCLDFIFLGDKMYYSTRNPDRVYCYDEGNSIAINDKEIRGVYTLFGYKGDLYYFEEIESDASSRLMRFNTKNNKISQVAVCKGTPNSETIVNGYLYYRTENYEAKSVPLQ